ELLSQEQQDQLPGRVSLLGSTLAESSPVQQRGPLRVMNAWAPAPKELEEIHNWDHRPLRDRPAPGGSMSNISMPSEGTGTMDGEANSDLPMAPDKVINWRDIEVPLASQIRGLARLQKPSMQLLAPKGWREPPELRPLNPAELSVSRAPRLSSGSGVGYSGAAGYSRDYRPLPALTECGMAPPPPAQRVATTAVGR
ncbi:unnamed protein product, partial [Polarella glacialis]